MTRSPITHPRNLFSGSQSSRADTLPILRNRHTNGVVYHLHNLPLCYWLVCRNASVRLCVNVWGTGVETCVHMCISVSSQSKLQTKMCQYIRHDFLLYPAFHFSIDLSTVTLKGPENHRSTKQGSIPPLHLKDSLGPGWCHSQPSTDRPVWLYYLVVWTSAEQRRDKILNCLGH